MASPGRWVKPQPALDVVSVDNPIWEQTLLLPRLPDGEEAQVHHLSTWVQWAQDQVWEGGGSAANSLVALTHLGLRCGLLGRVGDDPAGHLAREALARVGVEVRVEVRPGRTTKTSVIVKEAATDRGFFRAFVPTGVVPPVEAAEIDDTWLLPPGMLHLDRVSELGLALALRRAAAGGGCSLDLHTCPGRPLTLERLTTLLPCLKVAMLSEGAARDLARAWGWEEDPALVALRVGRHVPWTVVTVGAGGCWWVEGGEVHHQPALPCPDLIDSTGAGDTFMAGLLEGHLHGRSLEQSVRRASVAASLACTRLGARGRAVTLADVGALLPLLPAGERAAPTLR